MNGQITDRKVSRILFIMCWLAYTAVMIGRNSYSSALAAIINDNVFTKIGAGFISSLFFAFYSAGQLLSGLSGNKISAFKMIMVGLVLTACANFAMSISQNHIIMSIIWSINGFAQSMIWPAILRILSCVLVMEHRKKAYLYITTSFSAGILLSYMMSLIILRYFNWNVIFAASAYILFFAAGLWVLISVVTKKALMPDEKENVPFKVHKSEKDSFYRMITSSGIVIMLAPAIIKCMLDVGIKTWVPTMIMETYSVTPIFSTFLAMFLPIVNLAGPYTAVYLQKKIATDEIKTVALLYFFCLPLMCLLLLIGKINIFVCILILAIITTFVTAINQLMLVSMPIRFARYGKTSSVSGLMGIETIGIIISNNGFGYLAETFGWGKTILSWILITIAAIYFCMLASKKWTVFIKGE